MPQPSASNAETASSETASSETASSEAASSDAVSPGTMARLGSLPVVAIVQDHGGRLAAPGASWPALLVCAGVVTAVMSAGACLRAWGERRSRPGPVPLTGDTADADGTGADWDANDAVDGQPIPPASHVPLSPPDYPYPGDEPGSGSFPGHHSPGDAARRFDHESFDRLSARMSLLLRDFLAHTVPRPERPAAVDLRAPATRWFVDAFTAASDLLIGTSQTDHPATLTAAVREAERRWLMLRGWCNPATGPTEDDGGNVPPAGG